MTSYAGGTIVQTGVNGSSTANTATADATVPADVTAGQKMFAVVVQQSVPSTTGVITPVVGGSWTLRPEASGHAGTTNPVDLAVFTRTATAADAASTDASPVIHQFTGTNVQGRIVAAIVGYADVDDTSPILAASFSTGTSSASRAATLTTTAPAWLLMAVADRAASSYSAGASGMLERVDLADAIAPTAVSNTSLAVYDSAAPVAAGTITRTVTAAGAAPTSSTQAAVIIALRPAAATNASPTVSVTPSSISGAEPGETYTVTATVADSDGTIASTAFSSATLTLTGTGLSRSFVVPLSLTADAHTITVTTTDNAGATSSATVAVSANACDEAIHNGTQLIPFVEYVMA